MSWYYLSTSRMTVAVQTDEGDLIIATPPIVRKFRGQPLENLIRWMSRQGNFRLDSI